MTPPVRPRREAVCVEAPARLHFGVLDLRGARGRWFGGIGAAAPGPRLRLSARLADRVEVDGEDAERAGEFARRVLGHHGLEGGVRVTVHQALPAHVGLGSGTQLALAVARAVEELYDLGAGGAASARAAGRADRLAIGTHAFAEGGLVVEGGRRPDGDGLAPLLVRMRFPSTWRCVVAVPRSGRGLSGPAEDAAIDAMPPPPEREVERVAHLVLMNLLPALAEADLPAFGETLSAIQSLTGRWWAPVQGGTFAAGPTEALVRAMSGWGAMGVGQSSWGPAVYGIVDGEEAGRALAGRVRASLGGAGSVYHGPFPSTGARTWREEPETEDSRPERARA